MCVCVCVVGVGVGGWRYLRRGVRVCAHACACFDDPQMGTADAEILSTQKHFQALSLLSNDVHLEDCHAPYNTCKPVNRYRKRFRSLMLCPLLCE